MLLLSAMPFGVLFIPFSHTVSAIVNKKTLHIANAPYNYNTN
jgi:hypothetical protein